MKKKMRLLRKSFQPEEIGQENVGRMGTGECVAQPLLQVESVHVRFIVDAWKPISAESEFRCDIGQDLCKLTMTLTLMGDSKALTRQNVCCCS